LPREVRTIRSTQQPPRRGVDRFMKLGDHHSPRPPPAAFANIIAIAMQHTKQVDEQVIEKARRVVAVKRRFRWFLLLYATLFLGMCGYFTVAGIRKIESLDELSLGFAYGVAMAVVWMSFGVMGGLCLGKFLIGLQSEYRLQELLISYHDRLRDLGQLQEEKIGEPSDPGNWRQPFASATNRASGAAGSRRRPSRSVTTPQS
jgi:hypothetical protein